MDPPPVWMVEEWNFFQMAKWLGVAPWELAAQDPFWQGRAAFYLSVENGLRQVRKEFRGSKK